MTITEKSIKAFKDSMLESEKAKATIEKYCHAATDLMTYTQGRPITKKLLLEYRDHLLESMSTPTVNGYITAINQFLCFCKKRSLRLKIIRVQRRAFIDESRELTEKEYSRLVSAAQKKGKERLHLILQAIGGTGIRISELPFITVEAVDAGQADVALKGKHRIVLIPKRLRKKLLSYAKRKGIESGPVFVTASGRPVDRSNIAHDMKALCETAHVDPRKVFPHNLRHLFARAFYAIEKNLAHLADILGHSSVETTRIYVAASVRTFEKTVNKMKLIM